MSVKEDFCEAWKARFSTSNFPELDYLDGTPNQEQLESAFKSCQNRIEALKTELKHQEFISEFLWKLLHQDSSSERSQTSKTRPDSEHGSIQTELSANTNGLDAIVPTGNVHNYPPCSSAKQGNNALGSVGLSVRPFVCVCSPVLQEGFSPM